MSESDPVADWAASGAVALTGRPDGPPLVPPGRAATRARALAARIAGLTGGAVRVDGAALLAERAAFTGATRQGPVSAGVGCRLLETADGWAAVSCVRPDDPMLLGALVGAELPDGEGLWPLVEAWLRAHTGAELAERATLLGLAAGPVAPGGRAVEPVPLPAEGRSVDGLLVVDFSALWAGPLCAHLLGLAGARVVKVETPSRPDGARRGHPGFYRLLHAGHRSVVLDPRERSGRHALRALVEKADIVIEASRPRALAGFGLDAHASAAAGTTWISITAAGRAADRVGFGDDVAAGAGLVAREPGGVPLFCGDAIADPLTGLTAAARALARPPGGSGAPHDISMTDVVAATLDPGPPSPSVAARRAGEGWVVDASGGPVPVAPPRHRTPAGRAARSGEHTAGVLRELRIPVP
ncbi:CoA transferase [Actinomadura sp. KC216]|uniref:CoA transferase n=1 Tax=Actinomadura sp. KC216 TaxID=2530370 RepID=UPI00104ADCD6|nr:CoA transferase [Actinomadura sp. KC216]TDB85184.1 CoA transferase [Actinomadura sp. KC216]